MTYIRYTTYMKCADAEFLLLDLAHVGLDATTYCSLGQHLAFCEECDYVYEEFMEVAYTFRRGRGEELE